MSEGQNCVCMGKAVSNALSKGLKQTCMSEGQAAHCAGASLSDRQAGVARERLGGGGRPLQKMIGERRDMSLLSACIPSQASSGDASHRTANM